METKKELVDAMMTGEILHGFYFNLGKKEYFCKTEYKNKTKILASKILRKLLLPENPDTIAELMYWMCPAKCQIKHTQSGGCYYDIFGKNFSGYGSESIEDGKTIVFEI